MRSSVSLVRSADVTPEPTNATPGPSEPTAAKTNTGAPRATTSTVDFQPLAFASDSGRDEDESDMESVTSGRGPAGLDASPPPEAVPPPVVDTRKNQAGSALTPYEQKRADAIARNKTLLAELGLKDGAKNMFAGSASGSDAATPATKPKPKPRMKKTVPAPAEARVTR